MDFDEALLSVLACPAPDHGRLVLQRPRARLGCTVCGRTYPIRDGIPVLLLDEAEDAPNSPGTS